MTTYRVKSWRRFQHYTDRNPPWIKLHFEILSSRDWVTLDDASRVLAIACMLIASRNEGCIPDDPEYIQRVAYLRKPPDFKPLIKCGFLEVASECKQMLATARPETETETETEVEAQALNGFHEKPKRPSRTAPEGFKPDLVFASLIAPDMDAQAEASAFLDYEFSTPKSDWNRVWKTWVRRALREGRYTKRNGKDPYAGAV